MDPLKHIVAGQHVILKLPSNNSKIVELKPDGSISLGKFGSFNVNDILGYALGTTFEIYYNEENQETNQTNKNKNPVGQVRVIDNSKDTSANEESRATSEENDLNSMDSSLSNKNLINVGNEIQKMTMDEIEQLKKQSVSGNEIIAKMIESHGSFHQKTSHSQEKYLKRKKQKFSKRFTVNYLSSSALLSFLLEKGDIQRVMDMSEESMGMLLNLANIRSNGTYLCMDGTGGLLVYFLLERMFGGDIKTKFTGKIVVIHENEHPNLDLLKFSNYPEEFIRDHVKTISILDYFEPPTVEEIQQGFTPLSKEEVHEMKGNRRNAYFRRLKLYKGQLEMVDYATKVQYDGLVVATTLSLPSLIPRLSEHVHGSRPIVCYSQFKETLLELSHTLYDDLRFLAPSIVETRCRPYQTIRGKLHPLMTMRGGGGYLLSCNRVIPAPEPEPVQAKGSEEPIETLKKQKTE
ncbi:hypothetical protein Kpol_1003p14 [Vanderwaltozyma polyspora DSM 70294]|uniref:tRNA (adenine(58)-N(1))-methyltransferase non-catalytic subunit TRM6 n=1 Tax=Vanderwaltozyma polyspora (strain ATCC 22028 / DSM 70294 / BCRC 21397 / CBS 2163 / NBRC 10782 / NRRL Y-8283 / UCD 57-17) TaxID=436907 RepID=A7TLX2_VANPO|nr:uncharacterized protein Kpol_1003p14 [Vanderwaltozyma polyspora DSM 70294]EDO16709.1 hypothetical protein Kpol_1003p14 [Vanderwaltozyma polyspora DSM 70294]